MVAEDDRSDEETVCDEAYMSYLVLLLSLMTSLFEQALVALFY